MMTCFEDTDHAGCRDTRRSHTGIIIMINRAPIMWFSKRQSTCEASTFGSELVAAHIATKMVKGLRLKLRPQCSATMKKHCLIAYHLIREAQAAGIISMSKEDGKTNLANIAAKLNDGPTLRYLCQYLLW
jgi:hypothetical protein